MRLLSPTLAAAALAATTALSVAGPAEAIQRNSVPTHLVISAPTDLHRGDVSRITVTVTADPGYHDEMAGTYRCRVQHVGDAYHYGVRAQFDSSGTATLPQATIPAGTYDVLCSFTPYYTWSVLQTSSDVTSYTVTEP